MVSLEAFFFFVFSIHSVIRCLLFALNQQSCIENKDPVIQALGFQSLAHLCEADIIGNPVVY